MKKLCMIALVLFIFIFGLKMGETSHSPNSILEKEKDKFETEIVTPNNGYTPKTLQPEENMVNKTAHKIDRMIDQVVEKMKSILKKL
ncbi:MAG: hypothetical protein NC090_01210 [Anaeroplasma bactoclasticum]|nr:hypothetical protein [Anaeroplasma bactoclasticum]